MVGDPTSDSDADGGDLARPDPDTGLAGATFRGQSPGGDGRDQDVLQETKVGVEVASAIQRHDGVSHQLTGTVVRDVAPAGGLDEVDAPLDDANVGKFTNMIRQFSENSQFIIVTHNKMTMSTVDVIYGVTMQEPGVSKLVTVDFRSLQQN